MQGLSVHQQSPMTYDSGAAQSHSLEVLPHSRDLDSIMTSGVWSLQIIPVTSRCFDFFPHPQNMQTCRLIETAAIVYEVDTKVR